MRKQTAVLLFLMILSGITVWLYFRTTTGADRRPGSVIKTMPRNPAVFTNTPFSRDVLDIPPFTELPAFSGSQETAPEKFISRLLPDLLAGKEGGYTNPAGIFKASPSALSLRSEWITSHLFPARALPSMSIRVVQDPNTGEYRIFGGALALPGTGLEAGYEAELNSDEYKATLQWKKSF